MKKAKKAAKKKIVRKMKAKKATLAAKLADEMVVVVGSAWANGPKRSE